jgi:8-oxo-dGTP pyrophosphatase MutT (NUDIX family)
MYKQSYGVACCRYNNRKVEILMIKKRCTYAFVEFALGRYNPKASKQLRNLFSQMTVDEKHDVASMNFAQIWYRVWLTSGQGVYWYFAAACKYKCLIENEGVELKRLINKTPNGQLHWEIPKGRKHRNESPIECAVREFEEETTIQKNRYHLFLDKKLQYRVSDGGYVYDCIFFVACAKNVDVTDTYFNIDSASETVESRWMSADDIQKEHSITSARNTALKAIRLVNKLINS